MEGNTYQKKVCGSPEPATNTTLAVFGLSKETTEWRLFLFFRHHGKLRDVHIVLCGKDRKSAGFGFVSFKRLEDAMAAVAKTNGAVLDDQKIHVTFAEKKHMQRTHKSMNFYMQTHEQLEDAVAEVATANVTELDGHKLHVTFADKPRMQHKSSSKGKTSWLKYPYFPCGTSQKVEVDPIPSYANNNISHDYSEARLIVTDWADAIPETPPPLIFGIDILEWADSTTDIPPSRWGSCEKNDEDDSTENDMNDTREGEIDEGIPEIIDWVDAVPESPSKLTVGFEVPEWAAFLPDIPVSFEQEGDYGTTVDDLNDTETDCSDDAIPEVKDWAEAVSDTPLSLRIGNEIPEWAAYTPLTLSPLQSLSCASKSTEDEVRDIEPNNDYKTRAEVIYPATFVPNTPLSSKKRKRKFIVDWLCS